MVVGVFIVVAVALGAYGVAEQKGRPPLLWMMLAVGVVFASYCVTYLATQSFVSSNVIFTGAGGAAALAVVGAGPIVGAATGISVIAWLMQAPASASMPSSVQMYGGFEDEDMREMTVRVDGRALVLVGNDAERRLETNNIQRAEVDGEYLIVHVDDEPSPLKLRPVGDAYKNRERCVALVELMARRLKPESC
jgi:hypothetical protein